MVKQGGPSVQLGKLMFEDALEMVLSANPTIKPSQFDYCKIAKKTRAPLFRVLFANNSKQTFSNMTCYTMGKFPDFALLLPESGGQNIFDINLNSLLGGPFQLPRVIV